MIKQVFMIMPFNDRLARDIYEFSTKPICEEFGLMLRRADEIFTVNPILEDIVSEIEKATIVIADISGKNTNVFYELGIAHILKKSRTIMITHDKFDTVPFDVAHFRILQYENSITGKAQYEKNLRKTLEVLLQDIRALFQDEFKIVANICNYSDRFSDLILLVALSKLPVPPSISDEYEVVGHKEKDVIEQFRIIPRNRSYSHFIEMGYIEIVGNTIILTTKGKALVEYLEEQGYVCDFAMGHIFTKGFVYEPLSGSEEIDNNNK